MARLWSSGAELNSQTVNVEITTDGATIAPSTVQKRTGTYSFRAGTSHTSSTGIESYQAAASNQNTFIYIRAYIYIASMPSTSCGILKIGNGAGATGGQTNIYLITDGTLQLRSGGNVQVGSSSSTLSLNTQYLVELSMNGGSNPSTIEGRLNGVTFASGNDNAQRSWTGFMWGAFDVSNNSDIYFDDLALNDSSGSFQNSFPGAGQIIHLRPSATGDNSDWTGDNTDIDEVTPDDATTKISNNLLSNIEDVNIDDTPAGIGASDTINVVQVGVRYNGAGASLNAAFALRIKASSGGTVETSSDITPADTTWVTNANATPRNYALTLYDLPGASTTVWTKSDLDTTQIGVITDGISTNAAQISTLWLLVDSTPFVQSVIGNSYWQGGR